MQVKENKPEKTYAELAKAVHKNLPGADYKLALDWCFENNPVSLECLFAQLGIYFQDKDYKAAKEFIDNITSGIEVPSEDGQPIISFNTIKLVGEALNTLDAQSLKSQSCTEEVLKALRISASDEVKEIDREFWLYSLRSKCDCLKQIGIRNHNEEYLFEAIHCYEIVLRETLKHKDVEDWRLINQEISDIYNSLWEQTNDISFLEKEIEYIREIILDIDVNTDRQSWVSISSYLASRIFNLGKQTSSKKYLSEGMKLVEHVFREYEKDGNTEVYEHELHMMSGNAYTDIDRLEQDIKHLKNAVAHFQKATNTDNQEIKNRANIALAETLQEIGIRTNDHEVLKKALIIIESFRNETSKRREPAKWAYHQAWSAEVKYQIGDFGNDFDLFLESAKTYKEAYDAINRKGISKTDHVNWKYGQGLSLLRYCENNEKCKSGFINDAIKCFLSVLNILTPDEGPWEYANTQDNLGDAYLSLGRRKRSSKHIKMALDTFREAFATFEKYSYAEHVPELTEKIDALTQELETG